MRKLVFAIGLFVLACHSNAPEVVQDDAGVCAREGGLQEVSLPLQKLCEMLEKDGRLRCPTSRRELAARPGTCPDTLLNRCDGFDSLLSSLPFEHGFTFDEAGKLVAAWVIFDRFACNAAYYESDDAPAECLYGDGQACPLCYFASPGREQSCPADVIEVLPNVVCVEPPADTECICQQSPTNIEISGELCTSPRCTDCKNVCGESYTCECADDGRWRWKSTCIID